MDSETINGLLEKYWNGETSLEEERLLHEYFSRSGVPESMKETAALFTYFRQQRSAELADRKFESRIIEKLDRPVKRLNTFFYNSMRIAAGVAVLVLAVWLVRLELRETSPADDTYSDPERAFQETKKALLMISRSFSTAEEQARKINLFNEAQEELKKPEPADI